MTLYLQETLRQGRRLQRRYDKISAPRTQTVRNPYPMWQLVLESLPFKKAPRRAKDLAQLLSPEDIFLKIVGNGYRATMAQIYTALAQLHSFKQIAAIPLKYDRTRPLGYGSHFVYYRVR